jgi:hypothetical protein
MSGKVLRPFSRLEQSLAAPRERLKNFRAIFAVPELFWGKIRRRVAHISLPLGNVGRDPTVVSDNFCRRLKAGSDFFLVPTQGFGRCAPCTLG